MKNKKITKEIAFDIKMAAKRQREEAHLAKLKRTAARKANKPTCGKHSALPTDHNWEAINADRSRFFDDKLVKGANRRIEYIICNL